MRTADQLLSLEQLLPISSRRVLDIMQARVYEENPDDRLGVIQVRGEYVVVDYYKNAEATKKYSPETAECAPAT
jgi:hypothetical protein